MKKDVLIRISGLHGDQSEDGDMELIVNGSFMEGDGKSYISYEETDSDGSVHKCRIRVGREEVVYTKEGVLTTELYYCIGSPYESVISTPYGQLDAEIVTQKIEFRDNSDALLDLRLDYLLTINNEYASDCIMKILVQNIEKN